MHLTAFPSPSLPAVQLLDRVGESAAGLLKDLYDSRPVQKPKEGFHAVQNTARFAHDWQE